MKVTWNVTFELLSVKYFDLAVYLSFPSFVVHEENYCTVCFIFKYFCFIGQDGDVSNSC